MYDVYIYVYIRMYIYVYTSMYICMCVYIYMYDWHRFDEVVLKDGRLLVYEALSY
jgi:hypothetical protein